MTVAMMLVVGAVATGAVMAELGGGPTASQSQLSSDVVAQAHAGISDALFRLDQMGNHPSPFCVGAPPADALPSGLTLASCVPSGPTPLPSAPDLQWYVVSAVSGTLPAGVTNEFDITVHATSSNQQRTASAVLYREADDFGFFGVSSFTSNGALKQANVEVVASKGQASQGSVYFGVGPGGTASCSGNDANSQIKTVGQRGSTVTSCPQPTDATTALEPSSPSVCASHQSTSAFAPCVDTSSFATSGGSDYCPLPGSGVPNVLPTSQSLLAPPPAPDSGATSPVFDCSSGGAALTVTTSASLPFQLSKIPAGTYYLDSNAVTLGEIDPSDLAGPVNLFILPAGCTSLSCPEPAATPSCPSSTSPSLTIAADNNVPSGATPPPGNPADWNVFYEGAGLSVAKKIWFDGSLYAPDASLTSDGATGLKLFGSLVLDCWTVNGAPTLTFAYPFSAQQYVVNWSVTDFKLSE